ncbi:hypothetical protein GQ53DRAFT_222872 [Thozetella sp. PMI_491]|nr:hypothetical protein GQ53DRAFT_222872 [Thozetella sp. PMI_491]
MSGNQRIHSCKPAGGLFKGGCCVALTTSLRALASSGGEEQRIHWMRARTHDAELVQTNNERVGTCGKDVEMPTYHRGEKRGRSGNDHLDLARTLRKNIILSHEEAAARAIGCRAGAFLVARLTCFYGIIQHGM